MIEIIASMYDHKVKDMNDWQVIFFKREAALWIPVFFKREAALWNPVVFIFKREAALWNPVFFCFFLNL